LNEGEDAMQGGNFFGLLELQAFKFRCSVKMNIISEIF